MRDRETRVRKEQEEMALHFAEQGEPGMDLAEWKRYDNEQLARYERIRQANLAFDAEVGDEVLSTHQDNTAFDAVIKLRVSNPWLSARLSKLAFVIDLTALALSGSGAVVMMATVFVGSIVGGVEGAIAGASLGFLSYQPLNILENALGWISFGIVFPADIFSGNTFIYKGGEGWTLYIGQDTLVALLSAIGGLSPDPLSDSVFNGAIIYYDTLRFFRGLPTSYNLKIFLKGIQLGSLEEIFP